MKILAIILGVIGVVLSVTNLIYTNVIRKRRSLDDSDNNRNDGNNKSDVEE